mgnify:CR=1 FL=1
MFSKGLPFNKIKSFSIDGGIVYKDTYYNSKVKKYRVSKSRQEHSKRQKSIIALAIRANRDFEGCNDLLKSLKLDPVKESYFDMTKRVASYGKDALNSWVNISQPMTFYKENF